MSTEGERSDQRESDSGTGPAPAPLDLPTWELDVEAPQLEPAAQPTPPEQETASAPPRPPATEIKEETAPPPLLRILEAMLFVGGAPLTAVRACEAVRGLSPDEFQQAIDLLQRNYRSQGRPYTIQLQEQ